MIQHQIYGDLILTVDVNQDGYVTVTATKTIDGELKTISNTGHGTASVSQEFRSPTYMDEGNPDEGIDPEGYVGDTVIIISISATATNTLIVSNE